MLPPLAQKTVPYSAVVATVHPQPSGQEWGVVLLYAVQAGNGMFQSRGTDKYEEMGVKDTCLWFPI